LPESQFPVGTENFDKRQVNYIYIIYIYLFLKKVYYIFEFFNYTYLYCFGLSARFLWYSKWASETSLSLQALQNKNATTVGIPTVKGKPPPPSPYTHTERKKTFHLLHDYDLVVLIIFLTEYSDAVQNVSNCVDEIELNDRLKFFWDALERICGAANFANTLNHGKKNQKKAALSNLFKTLEECGLSKHRSMGHEVL
jgi:midasin